MKHLKTFESFNGEIINEELFGMSKSEKAVKKFKTDNASQLTELKNAENALDKSDESSQEKLAGIQKDLYSQLRTFTKAGGELMSLLGISKVDSDYNQIFKDLKDEIMNIEAFDDRSAWQKFVTGAGAGREGWTSNK